MSFHQTLRQGAPLITTFVKTPHPMVVELLGGTGLDAILLDGEHSTFGVAEMDSAILAARAVGKPILVRVPDERPSDILRILDMGADGVVVPHVSSAEQAAKIVKSAKYGDGGRGFASTTRAGGFGTSGMAAHLAASNEPTVIVQIEDPLAVENIKEIVAVPGVSGVFIGAADLAVAYGVNDLKSPRVVQAVKEVIAAAQDVGMPVAGFAGNIAAAKAQIALGITFVVLGTEHTAMQTYYGSDTLAELRDLSGV